VAATFGPAALAIVLTGMGYDGAAGARSIAEGGGSVIAQDAASSVVWGMPGAAAAVGACAAMLPPAEIAATAAKLIKGERP
jgi:two-component system chemotaxis response regulator CheB